MPLLRSRCDQAAASLNGDDTPRRCLPARSGKRTALATARRRQSRPGSAKGVAARSVTELGKNPGDVWMLPSANFRGASLRDLPASTRRATATGDLSRAGLRPLRRNVHAIQPGVAADKNSARASAEQT